MDPAHGAVDEDTEHVSRKGRCLALLCVATVATAATAAAVDLVNWFHTGVGIVDSRGVRAHRRPDQRHDPSRRREHLSGRGREAVMAHPPDVAEVVIIGVTERIGARSRSAS